MSAITWAVQADMDFDTVFETALTGYVERPGNGIRIAREIGPDGAYRTSKVSITLSNRGGEFTPENSASSFYGQLVPGVPIRVVATHASVDYTLWTGYVQRWKTGWKAGTVSLCELTCYDLWHYLQEGVPVDVAASVSRDTDAALLAIATSIGLDTGDYSFADGLQDLPVHFAVGQNPASAMQDVADAEMFGWLFVNAAGQVVFQSRSSRLGTSVDDTWGDGTGIVPHAVDYDLDPLEYVTNVRARGVRFAVGDADVEVQRWSVGVNNGLHLASGQVYERTFQAESATVSLTTPVAYTDYLANASDDGSGADRTGSLTVTLTDLGGGRYSVKLVAAAELYVHKFQVRGQPVALYPDRPEVVVSLPWEGEKAGQAINLDVPWVDGDSTVLLDYAMSQLRIGRYAPARLGLSFHAGNPDATIDAARKVAFLSLELGDLIKYADTGIGAAKGAYVDDWWYVNRIEIEVPPDFAGASFMVRVGLERSYDHRNLDAIEYDDFARADASGDLGTTASGAAWQADTGFNITSGKAAPANTSEQKPWVAVGGSGDMVVEVALSGLV